MAIHSRREVELKFKVGTELTDFTTIQQRLSREGYRPLEPRIETDYLPDTPDGLCKKNGLLLRFRQVQSGTQVNWILTLKTRGKARNILDFYEVEQDFSEGVSETFDHINNALQKATGHHLPATILEQTDLTAIRTLLANAGFGVHRILLEKYRQAYAKDNTQVLLDFFPDGLGAYVEIETYSPTAISTARTQLALQNALSITDDYGDLLKAHKVGLPDQAQRTGLFDEAYKDHLLSRSVQ